MPSPYLSSLYQPLSRESRPGCDQTLPLSWQEYAPSSPPCLDLRQDQGEKKSSFHYSYTQPDEALSPHFQVLYSNQKHKNKLLKFLSEKDIVYSTIDSFKLSGLTSVWAWRLLGGLKNLCFFVEELVARLLARIWKVGAQNFYKAQDSTLLGGSEYKL